MGPTKLRHPTVCRGGGCTVGGGGCTVSGYCDNSVREKDWRCRVQVTLARSPRRASPALHAYSCASSFHARCCRSSQNKNSVIDLMSSMHAGFVYVGAFRRLQMYESSLCRTPGSAAAMFPVLSLGDRVVIVSGVAYLPFGTQGFVASIHQCRRPAGGRSALEQEVGDRGAEPLLVCGFCDNSMREKDLRCLERRQREPARAISPQ